MTAPVAIAHADIEVEHHHFWIGPESPENLGDFARSNGIVEAMRDTAVVFTGISNGPIDMHVEIYDRAPTVSVAEWDEVVEFTLHAAEGTRMWIGAPDIFAKESAIPPLSSGRHRMRLHARGRDTAYDITVFEPVEFYLLQTWPTDAEQPGVDVLKTSDNFGVSRRAWK